MSLELKDLQKLYPGNWEELYPGDNIINLLYNRDLPSHKKNVIIAYYKNENIFTQYYQFDPIIKDPIRHIEKFYKLKNFK